MSRPYRVTIRQNRPWRLCVRQWKDTTDAIQALADFSWHLVADTRPPLDIEGTIDADGVLFSQTAAQTGELAAGSATYAVKATPLAGGEPVYVFEGPAKVERTAVS